MRAESFYFSHCAGEVVINFPPRDDGCRLFLTLMHIDDLQLIFKLIN